VALPPEPLAELLARASSVVVAEVAEVVSTGPLPPRAKKVLPTDVDVGMKTPSQKVKLKVSRTLKGISATEVVVEKPEAAYRLVVGESGAFFLESGKIIGRYGPNTHKLDKVEAALKTPS
jgi:hypothetical protein